MRNKPFSEILKIKDPWQRLMAAIVLQASLDYFNFPDVETFLDAYNFLYHRGGIYDNFVDYDIKEIFELAKEHHERMRSAN